MASADGVEILDSAAEGAGWRLALRIPEDTPLCEGHFPGHPIVPGIAHLAWVERALGDLRGRPGRLRSIRGFRLRRPVLPGDELELTLQPAGAGDRGPSERQEVSSPAAGAVYLFTLRRGSEAVSDGRVEAGGEEEIQVGEGGAEEGREEEIWVRESRERGSASGAYPPVESLIPHRGPMRLLGQVLRAEEGRLVGEAAVPADNPLARGRAPSWLALEAAAQAAAALEALARRDDAGPRLGYLVGVREARLRAADLPAGAPFSVLVRGQGSAGPLAVYEATAERDGAPILTATLSTYLPA